MNRESINITYYNQLVYCHMCNGKAGL